MLNTIVFRLFIAIYIVNHKISNLAYSMPAKKPTQEKALNDFSLSASDRFKTIDLPF